MADNSGSRQNKNNNRNPTLRDHERAQGRSGAAIHARGVKSTSGETEIDVGQDTSTARLRETSRDSGHN